MRQVGMWLTIIGFAVLVLGLSLLLKSYIKIGAEEGSKLDKAEIKIKTEPKVDIAGLEKQMAAGKDEAGKALSAEERLQLAQQVIAGLKDRLDALQKMKKTADVSTDYKDKIQKRSSQASALLAVGLVLAIVGVIIVIATPASRRVIAERQPSAAATTSPAAQVSDGPADEGGSDDSEETV